MKKVLVKFNKTNTNIITNLATKHPEIAKGLMYKKNLKMTEGMLFFFNTFEYRSFWMKNTYIPLDIIFLRNDIIVDIKPNNRPLSLKHIESSQKCNIVLEVNSNFSKYYNIKIGDKVTYHMN
jgi:uncharacterized protein